MSADGALVGLALSIMGLFGLWAWQRTATAIRLEKLLPTRCSQTGRIHCEKKPGKLEESELISICAETASRLRAGESPRKAWKRTLSRVLRPGGEEVLDVEGILERSGEAGQIALVSMRFAEQTGAPLAAVLERTSHALSERERADQALQVAFSGPRVSVRVLSALPLVGLLGGEALGAHPIEWFFDGASQVLLLVLGVALAALGNGVSRGMARRAMRAGQGKHRAPVYCDLAVSGLQGGMAIPLVLSAIGSASGEREYGRIGKELELGATWHEAWDPLPDTGELLYRALEPAWVDGISPTALLAGVAEHARASAASEAKKAAEKLGVKLAFPLGLLLLPSFIILGLVPVFFSLVGGELGGLIG
ncbi:hypothetical protein U6G28_04065 [Actinomycetaceae bacterium MB13-C1-2]|nr:hypothetical protein U6G28_04065 [Actinomycetaceae bacterium MB13-C1-2]